jgi:hypothetical protein
MASVKPSVNRAVPSAVEFSADNSVPVIKTAIKGPYRPQKGSSIIPVVPRTDTGEAPPQPHFTGGLGHSAPREYSGSAGAPSVPRDGFLFKKGPVDPHYQVTVETKDPYKRVNNPGTSGWRSRIQMFANHIAYHQNTTNTGFKVSGPQQRTSVMINTLPPVGKFGTETYTPRQMPQAVPYNRIRPYTGTDAYGTGVLNRDTFGAGQTAGGVGGSNYTPSPGPPATNSVTAAPVTGEPTWG